VVSGNKADDEHTGSFLSQPPCPVDDSSTRRHLNETILLYVYTQAHASSLSNYTNLFAPVKFNTLTLSEYCQPCYLVLCKESFILYILQLYSYNRSSKS